ncbi:MAG: efflux RND transporter periplasmic adaptor subunit [bacterium]|nr:efflux RND transporter periplasmic adaptor subunit [bacterium]
MERISHFFGAIKSLITRRPWVSVLVTVIILSGVWYLNSNKPATIKTFEVKRGEVSQMVSVTGTVKPSREVELSFEKSGRVAWVNKIVGDKVVAGTVLVSLENGEISALLEQAKASVKSAEAKLAELRNGTRPEDINISEIAVQNAINDVMDDIKLGYVYADDAIRNKVDQLMTNTKSANPKLNFVLNDSQLQINIENDRPNMESTLNSWNVSIAGLSSSSNIPIYINEAKNNLSSVQLYLDKIALAVNSLTTSSNLNQTVIDGYKAAIVLGRTNITTALGNLSSAEEGLRNAQSELALKQAGTVPEQISAQEATVDGAKANVLNLQAQMAKTAIHSPISGIVTKQSGKVGEIAGAGTPVVSVISEGKFEIEANVPEADIAKIKLGDNAEVTLDAYGNDVFFSAVVTQIDPAETIIENVATYKTTLQFTKEDIRIKSGMTANTDISGAKRESVLFIPSRAIVTKGTTKTVTVVEGDKTREVDIIIGLRGTNGDVEVMSGLNEGDKVKIN